MSAIETRREIMGCKFDPLTTLETIKKVTQWIDDGERASHTIITVNVAILMMARSDRGLSNAIRRADLVVADGAPIVWASRWLGSPIPERITGVDFMQQLLSKGARRGLRIFLLGTTETRLRRLVRVVQKDHPGVIIAGARNGYFDLSKSSEVVQQIRDSAPDVLLIGMPAPLKEIWCEEHRDALNVPAILGVGGAFDVFAGFVPRAPRAMQHTGLEWLWRLAMEPRKLWRRYLKTNSQFVWALSGDLAKRLLQRPGAKHRRQAKET